jgi:hypothetical protein
MLGYAHVFRADPLDSASNCRPGVHMVRLMQGFSGLSAQPDKYSKIAAIAVFRIRLDRFSPTHAIS